ncbi:MAG: phosphoribosylaminoimidazolesuccinocarboxamide synthase [Solirubrobacteraceae bacterium]|nr:phosphoribosylaminoimidazolesuccinocarboxamide synthase [Solirubrobacteraceae bacterium]
MPRLTDLPLIASGKVRELYDLGDDRLLLVATDRISTYDAIHPTPIPGKGSVLTGLSVFWFGLTADVVPNHFLSDSDGVPDEVKGRAIVVKKLQIVPIEAIVRGYLSGSGWTDYVATGKVSGHVLPEGLQESDRLPAPLFTPSTKAELGAHDEAIDLDQAASIVGDPELLAQVQEKAVALYEKAAAHARERGLILADTKFEFGVDAGGVLHVADEVLTPDSSRYWPVDGYEPGHGQPSFDKQYVRDWATRSGWDKLDPAPAIPAEIVEGTSDRYRDAYQRITGEPLSDWLARIGVDTAPKV